MLPISIIEYKLGRIKKCNFQSNSLISHLADEVVEGRAVVCVEGDAVADGSVDEQPHAVSLRLDRQTSLREAAHPQVGALYGLIHLTPS